MRDTLRQLVALQQVDDELAGVEAEVAGLPGLRQAADADLAAAEETLAAARSRVEEVELARREQESELASTEERRRDREGKTAAVKTNEEYTALLAEIEGLKQSGGDLETASLEAMERVDEAREALSAAEKKAQEVGARVDALRKRLDARELELAGEQTRLTVARDEAAAKLPPDLLRTYQKVVERRRPGVVVVSTELCSGCRVGIPPQAFVNLISGTTIEVCGSCRRILIHKAMLSGEAVPAAAE